MELYTTNKIFEILDKDFKIFSSDKNMYVYSLRILQEGGGGGLFSNNSSSYHLINSLYILYLLRVFFEFK